MNKQERISGTFFKTVRGVYKITNTITGRVYVGQSREVQSRISSHFAKLEEGKHTTAAMQADWNQYGPDSFEVEVSEYVEEQDDRLVREAETIAEIIARGTEVYNTNIYSAEAIKSNIETRKARQIAEQEVATEKKRVLDAKMAARANEHDKTKGGSHKDSKKATRRKNDIFGNREIPEHKSGTPLERLEQRLRLSEADLRLSQEGVNGATETERPPAASVDENGQHREGYTDVYKPLSVRNNKYIAEKEDRLIDDWSFFCDGEGESKKDGRPYYCPGKGCGNHLKVDLTDLHQMAYAIKKYVAPELVEELIYELEDESIQLYWFNDNDMPYEEFCDRYDELLEGLK